MYTMRLCLCVCVRDNFNAKGTCPAYASFFKIYLNFRWVSLIFHCFYNVRKMPWTSLAFPSFLSALFVSHQSKSNASTKSTIQRGAYQLKKKINNQKRYWLKWAHFVIKLAHIFCPAYRLYRKSGFVWHCGVWFRSSPCIVFVSSQILYVYSVPWI